MLFNSFRFLIFFPCVFFLYCALPFRFRKYMLLAASYYFYMCWKPEFIVLILISTAIDYFCGLGIGKHRDSRPAARALLAVSLFMNLGLLFFFKYFNFFGETLTALCRAVSIPFSATALDIILPVGISFYTFQTLSYTIDVYRGRLEPERDFVNFALFVSFFPQLVAGPIETAASLLPQLKQEHSFSYDNAAWGLKLMAWGFFKKLVVADRLAALFVDPVYQNPAEYSGGAFVIATAAFAFQIYCDFGGYSDIARGCAKTMGIDLMVNFKAPYLFSASISEYWKRNHISLSEWFHDYVYISLGGQPERPLEKGPLCHNHLFPQRIVARGGVDLYHLGPPPGPVPERRGPLPPEEARPAPGGAVPAPGPRGPAVDLRSVLLLPGLLPGKQHGTGPVCSPPQPLRRAAASCLRAVRPGEPGPWMVRPGAGAGVPGAAVFVRPGQ